MGNRGGEVARPRPWRFVFGSKKAADAWYEFCNSHRNAADAAWVAITSNPTVTTERQHQLKGRLGEVMYEGRRLPQWQYEPTGAGRVWYLVDEEQRKLVLTHAGAGHPGATDKGKQRRRRGQTT